MKNLALTLILIAFIGISCTKQKPEDVALRFYNYLNQNQFEKAKELAAPSAKEFIDKLAEIIKEYPTSDTVPFQLMDVKKKENPVQGDTAIVNFKFGKFNSFITLVWMDGNYKIIYTDELKTLRIITVNSMKFTETYKELGDTKFFDLYKDFRLRITNLILLETTAIPYDPQLNTSYYSCPGCSTHIYLGKKEVNLKTLGDKTISFLLWEVSDDQREIMKNFTRTQHEYDAPYYCKQIFTAEGVCTGRSVTNLVIRSIEFKDIKDVDK